MHMWRCEKVIRPPSSISPISVNKLLLSLKPKIIYYLARAFSTMTTPKMVHIELIHFLESNTLKVRMLSINDDFGKKGARKGMLVN